MMTEQDMEVAQLQAENTALKARVEAAEAKEGAVRGALGLPGGTSLEELRAEVRKVRDAAKVHQREHDLVRQMRCELFTERLITQEEYTALASEHGVVRRLEDYDVLRAKLDKLEKRTP